MSRSLEFGDLKFPAGEQAATMQPDFVSIPTQERFGLPAVLVMFVGERV